MADINWGGGGEFAIAEANNEMSLNDRGGDHGGDHGGDRGCFNCGEPGHNKADCPKPRTFSGDCRSCGKEGHMSKDCPDRPPMACRSCGKDGHMSRDCPDRPPMVCRTCNVEGHMAKECPDKPPVVCHNCKEEGHMAHECSAPRKIDRDHIETVTPEIAWEEIKTAVKEQEVEDIKDAVQKYVKSLPDITFLDLETAFRAQSMGVYLIAIEKQHEDAFTNMDLQGNRGKKYTVSYRFDARPTRSREAAAWPASPAENLERLRDAGERTTSDVLKCRNCDEIGHGSRSCPNEKVERTDKVEVKCYNCDQVGHRVRDCPTPRADKFACRNCNKSGHKSAECTEPRDASNVECRKCNETGHFSRDCPQGGGPSGCRNCGQDGHMARDCTEPRVIKCRNCGGEGHTSRECPEPVNLSNVQCRNCDEMGHFSKDCPKPRDYSRVKCSNCGEMGHTKVRCKNDTIADAEGHDNESGGYNRPDNAKSGADGGDWVAGTSTAPAGGDDKLGGHGAGFKAPVADDGGW